MTGVVLLQAGMAAAADPGAPTLQVPVASGTSAVVTFTDQSSAEDTFEVYRRETNGFTTSIAFSQSRSTAGTGQVYSFTDAAPNQLGCYYAVAYDMNGTYFAASAELCVGGATSPFRVKAVAPALLPLQAMPKSVVVRWADVSNNETRFLVQRQNTSNEWVTVYWLYSRNTPGSGVNAEQYMWADTDTSQSAQCYRVVAENWADSTLSGTSAPRCTVRPDQDRFPAPVGLAAAQWSSFPNIDAASGDLYNHKNGQRLYDGSQTFGIGLDFYNGAPSNKFVFLGEGGSTGKLMMGQAMAIRVLGGKYLKYGHQTWGVDLVWSDTPSYEWYIVGNAGDPNEDSHAGEDPAIGTHTLWNRAAQAYLVNGHQSFGVNLNFYTVNGSLDPETPPAPVVHGVKAWAFSNCDSMGHPVHLFTQDRTANGPWVDRGGLQAAAPGNCRAAGQDIVNFTPQHGHVYAFTATDTQLAGCPADDPTNGRCQATIGSFQGDSTGFNRWDARDSNTIIW